MRQLDARFAGLRRLVSGPGLERLRSAHVGVVGIGGVGSWAVEALARSGIGALTLVDLDEVCVGNVNRQLHALDLTIGQAKVEVMAERVHGINPHCRVTPVAAFFTPATADDLLQLPEIGIEIPVAELYEGVDSPTSDAGGVPAE